jgi:hypothetical protein
MEMVPNYTPNEVAIANGLRVLEVNYQMGAIVDSVLYAPSTGEFSALYDQAIAFICYNDGTVREAVTTGMSASVFNYLSIEDYEQEVVDVYGTDSAAKKIVAEQNRKNK